jgi:dTDP-4-dehydrorhamnose 3,5-epimerase
LKTSLVQTEIQGVYLSKNNWHLDNRGGFTSFYLTKDFSDVFLDEQISQVNFSVSPKIGTVRGMHGQIGNQAEFKVVRCLEGKVFDVVVDFRTNSPTYLKWVGFILTPESDLAVIIPPGCLHGYQTLELDSKLLYLHTGNYSSEDEQCVRFDDPKVGIKWPLPVSEISTKDLFYKLIGDDGDE